MKNYGLIPSFLIKIMVVSFLVLGFLFPSASNAQTIQTTIRYVKPGALETAANGAMRASWLLPLMLPFLEMRFG